MVSRLADRDEHARIQLSGYFAEWRGLVATALRRMQTGGQLRRDADPDELATGLIAALQGGYVLAEASRNVDHMATAIEMALARIDSSPTTTEHMARAAPSPDAPRPHSPPRPPAPNQTASSTSSTPTDTAAALATQLRIDSIRASTGAGVRDDVVALVFGEVDVGVRSFSGGLEGGEALPERRCGGQVRR